MTDRVTQTMRPVLEAGDLPFRVFLAVSAFAGLRLGEAAALQVGDLDVAQKRLRVRRQVHRAGGGDDVDVPAPKYGSERTVFLPTRS